MSNWVDEYHAFREKKIKKDPVVGKWSFEKLDQKIYELVKNGKIHEKRHENTPRTDISPETIYGDKLEWPKTHKQWLEYSYDLLDMFDLCKNGFIKPNWDILIYRSETEFKSGIFSEFSPIWLILINQMDNDKIKHLAYKMVYTGISAFDNQGPIPANQPKSFRDKNLLSTKLKTNKLNSHMHTMMGLHENEEVIICDIEHPRQVYYPVESIKRNNGSWFQKPFFQPNGVKCLENAEWITNQMVEWIETGAVELVGHQSKVKDTLLLAAVVLAHKPGSNKYRACFDGGSWKTTEKYKVPCNLDMISDALLFVEKGDHLTKWDDKSGFLQFKFDKDTQDTIRFKWGKFIFNYYGSCFGLGRVPGDFQLGNSVVVNFLRKHDIPILLYLDDRLVIEKNLTQMEILLIESGRMAPKNAFLANMLMIAVGGYISRGKSTPICTTRIEFLGFVIDTVLQTIEIPLEKWEKFQLTINKVLNMPKIEYKELESLRGTMCSFIFVIRNTQLFIRRITEDLCLADKNSTKTIWINNRLVDELKIWKGLNTMKIIRPWILDTTLGIQLKIFTDASGFGGGWTEEDGSNPVTFYWTPEEARTNICVKEAIAIRAHMETNKIDLRNRRILYYCDNKAVCWSLHNGAKLPDLNDEIRKINLLAIELNAIVQIEWCDTKSQLADEPSRTIDLKEEIISKISFQKIEQFCGWKFNLDGAAMFYNNRCNRYISRIKDANSVHTNFLSYIPKIDDIIWLFPPFGTENFMAKHLFKYYANKKFALLFHVYAQVPIFLAFKPKTSKLVNLSTITVEKTLLPSKKKNHQEGYYAENRKPIKTMLLFNLI
jgi:hypothetical protein